MLIMKHSPILLASLLCLASITSATIRDKNFLQFFQTYEANQPPTKVGYKSTVTQVGVYINRIELVDSDYTLRLKMYFRMYWRDGRLAGLFDNRLDDITKISLTTEMRNEIWLPDVFFRNAISVETFQEPTDQSLTRVNSTGHVWFVRTLLASFSCPLIRHFSNQIYCPILFESYSHTTDTLTLDWMPTSSGFDPDAGLFGYTLVDTIKYNCTQTYSIGSFPCLELRFVFRRDAEGEGEGEGEVEGEGEGEGEDKRRLSSRQTT